MLGWVGDKLSRGRGARSKRDSDRATTFSGDVERCGCGCKGWSSDSAGRLDGAAAGGVWRWNILHYVVYTILLQKQLIQMRVEGAVVDHREQDWTGINEGGGVESIDAMRTMNVVRSRAGRPEARSRGGIEPTGAREPVFSLVQRPFPAEGKAALGWQLCRARGHARLAAPRFSALGILSLWLISHVRDQAENHVTALVRTRSLSAR